MLRTQCGRRATLAMIVLVSLACSTTSHLEDRVADFIAAHNTYHRARLTTLISEDARFIEFDGRVHSGAAAFLTRVGWDSASSTQWAIDAARQTSDSTMTARLSVTSAWHQLLGVGAVVHGPTTFSFRGGRLAEFTLGALESESQTRLDRALADFLAWAQHEYPQRLNRIRPEGRLDYQARRAADWIALIREWRTGVR